MRLFRFFWVTMIVGIVITGCRTTRVHNDGYRLVWSDEFDKDGMPDTSVWNFEHGFARNHEAQWYQPENAYCRGGLLVIEAKRVHEKNPNYRPGSNNWKTNREWIEYTSASLNTGGKKSWQYGRFEIRAKIDTAVGLWPAIWTLGNHGQWPSNGEIDIMEFYKRGILANVATGTNMAYSAKWFSVKKPLDIFNDNDWTSKFHVWRMDWDSRAIKLYVDDYLMNEVPLDSLYIPDGTNPFMQPHYVLLNLAIGGDNGGNPEHTSFPRRYEIDHVRIYQKK